MKVLDITGNPFSLYLNNGKTHEAIFSAFNKEELCQIYVRPVATNLIDFVYCSSYYCVSDWDVLNRLTFKSNKCGSVIKNANQIKADDSFHYTNGNVTSIGSKKGFAGVLRDLLWGTGLWKNQDLKSWLKAQKPDVIFIDGGGDSYMYNIALYISQYLNIPLVYYVTDDYVIYPKHKSIIQKIHHHFVFKKISEVISKSEYCYAIGEVMANEYSQYFRKTFGYVMNAINVLPYKPQTGTRKKIVISYFGSLGLNRDRIIASLGSMASKLFEINVYAFNINDESKRLLEENGVKYKGALKSEELDDAMYASDVLLHVESDDEESRAFTKLAISTKIPEYLMHSRLILGYGPTEVASMQLISNNNIGVVISSDDTKDEQMRKLEMILDSDNRSHIAERGYQFALENFDRKKIGMVIKEKFTEILKK